MHLQLLLGSRGLTHDVEFGSLKMLLRPEDAPLLTRLRTYNAAAEEGEHNMEMEKLIALIDETNFDHVMSIIPQVDPWIADDPENPMGTKLIIMSRLILKEQRCVAQARYHLTQLRRDYLRLTGDWTAEIEEIDNLQDTIAKINQSTLNLPPDR